MPSQTASHSERRKNPIFEYTLSDFNSRLLNASPCVARRAKQGTLTTAINDSTFRYATTARPRH